MKGRDVVIVGGGVVGASVAWHLASRGCRDILILDRSGGPGEGSTGRATGGYRAQYGTAINVRLSLLAREKLLRFRDEIGADSGYAPVGYLWLAADATELSALRDSLPIQHTEGLGEAREVDLDDIGRINPAVRRDGLAGGTWCPTDGYIRPLSMLAGYLAAAERLGARVEWGTDVVGFDLDGPRGALRIAAVRTTGGRVPAGAVVNAAGAWARKVAGYAGVDLPVTPLRRMLVATQPCSLLPASMPMTIFAGDGFHLRVRDDRVLLAFPTPGIEGDPFGIRVDGEWLDEVEAKARMRVPVLSDVELDRAGAWGGLYEMSPDKHAILGAAPGCPNLFLINGSSGHGVMHSPALGHLLAEIMLDGTATTLDAAPLRPTRFAEGGAIAVSGLL